MKTVVLSLGGSLIAPRAGIDTRFLKKFRETIINFARQGSRVVIICGGGITCRNYNAAAGKTAKIPIPNNELDRLGIKATELNAELLRVIFGKYAYPKVIKDYNRKNLRFRILISCGYLPGTSSDYDAVMWARNYKADYIANLTNIDYVYDKNPSLHRNAKKLKHLDWKTMQKIAGTRWRAGLNVPFDPAATKLAGRLKLKVAFLDGKNIRNLNNFLNRKKFKGSVIS